MNVMSRCIPESKLKHILSTKLKNPHPLKLQHQKHSLETKDIRNVYGSSNHNSQADLVISSKPGVLNRFLLHTIESSIFSFFLYKGPLKQV